MESVFVLHSSSTQFLTLILVLQVYQRTHRIWSYVHKDLHDLILHDLHDLTLFYCYFILSSSFETKIISIGVMCGWFYFECRFGYDKLSRFDLKKRMVAVV